MEWLKTSIYVFILFILAVVSVQSHPVTTVAVTSPVSWYQTFWGVFLMVSLSLIFCCYCYCICCCCCEAGADFARAASASVTANSVNANSNQVANGDSNGNKENVIINFNGTIVDGHEVVNMDSNGVTVIKGNEMVTMDGNGKIVSRTPISKKHKKSRSGHN